MARKTKFVTMETVSTPEPIVIDKKEQPKVEMVFKKLEEPKQIDPKTIAKNKLKQTLVNLRELSAELGTKYPNIRVIRTALDENIKILTDLFKVNEA